MPEFIDYSQYKTWMFCPWAWYEKYVLRRQKAWIAQGMRDDAMAVGSLVHAGLENWYGKRDPEIPQSTVEEINPTPEALRMAKGLVAGYINTYPRELWDTVACEEPIRFPVIPGVDGLAKIDMYFYIPTPTRIESGIQGYEIILNPGWWIQEYKTKSSSVKFAEYFRSWQTNMQADFQMLALQQQMMRMDQIKEGTDKINGLLINIIEKPNDYIPKRKCKQCEEIYAYTAWTPIGAEFRCPAGHTQKLKPLEERGPIQANYFRLMVERTPEQLRKSKCDIFNVAAQMQKADESKSIEQLIPNKDHCMNLNAKYANECEYFQPHLYGITTIDNPAYEDTKDYIGEHKNGRTGNKNVD